MSNPTWNHYLTRIGGKLVCVETLDDVPVCETCCGNGDAPRASGHTCPACNGTGRAWHWRIEPAAGMLVQVTRNGRWQVMYADRSDGEIVAGSELQEQGIPHAYRAAACTPLTPPPGIGCTLAEALSLLPGYELHTEAECAIGILALGGGLRAVFIGESDTDPLLHIDPHYSHGESLDPAAAEQAIQRHKAIAAYCAAWEAK